MGAIDGPSARHLSQAFADSGLPPPTNAIETAFLPARYYLVGASDLLGFGPARLVRYTPERYRVAELRVKDLTYTRRVGVMYRKDAYLSPAAWRFSEILKTTAKEIAAEKP